MTKTTGYILNGVYHKGETAPQLATTSSTYKNWNHERQRREHARDTIQPHVNGRLNPEFIMEYPKEAKAYGYQEG